MIQDRHLLQLFDTLEDTNETNTQLTMCRMMKTSVCAVRHNQLITTTTWFFNAHKDTISQRLQHASSTSVVTGRLAFHGSDTLHFFCRP